MGWLQRFVVRRFFHSLRNVALLFAWGLLAVAPLAAGESLAEDARLEGFRSLPQTAPLSFRPSPSPDAWERRAISLRRQALVSLGLWPLPERTPLRAVVHGRVEREEYTVEKVYFESLPGHFVSGNLYRPRQARGSVGRRPALLSPYGHWEGGRFNETKAESFEEYLKQGFERHDPSGRFPLQARCVHLARMGCVVFVHDMIGYADSKQIRHAVGGSGEPHPGGFESVEAYLQLVNIAGLQTWNSIRALDFLATLDDVDSQRIAVTGASGGGMQTLLLSAVDERPSVVAPVVSVFGSRAGAPCTYGPFLRTREGTIGLAALAAPRPLCVINAGGDWTSEFLRDGEPQLRQLYRNLGVEERFSGKVFEECPHNYNVLSREFFYRFLKEHLPLADGTPVTERPFQPLTREELQVWNDSHPAPTEDQVGAAHERAMVSFLARDAERQLAKRLPSDSVTLARYREIVRGALEVQIGRSLPPSEGVVFQEQVSRQRGGVRQTTGLLTHLATGSRLPFLLLGGRDASQRVVLWLHPDGKAGLFEGDRLRPGVARLLEAGFEVAGIDLFLQGEFLREQIGARLGDVGATGRRLERVELLEGASVQYTLGNRLPLFSERVGDILTAVGYLRRLEKGPRSVHVLGLEGAGPWAAAAGALGGDAIDGLAVDTAGFRFAALDDVRQVHFLPGGARYHDLPGMLALCAPRRLWLAGESVLPEVVRLAYTAGGVAERLTRFEGDPATVPAAAVDWLENSALRE